ncbi:S-layer homology domain-containing protein [Paenibacillus qinlingensis]|uniref:S-layer homology domain-containing protein n=1 Tax=Paenibacillus qinlingensis TaxID=1837343 RepID=UPI001565C7C6|nr:S-layer homology domain-containing protein [Paenibacillus qinlingensis]NQX59830.1 S-layer homology domain-containing protein [Paenibacillus qinlingensis]
MKRRLTNVISASAFILTLLVAVHSPVAHAIQPAATENPMNASNVVQANPNGISDGNYLLAFKFHKFNTDQVSVMQDYVEKPGRLLIKDGKALVQITLKQSNEIKQFKLNVAGSLVSPEIVATDEQNNTRTVQFEVKDLTAKVTGWVKIYWQVNDSFLYDHEYDIDLTFDKLTIKQEPAIPITPPVQEVKLSGHMPDVDHHWARDAIKQAVQVKIANGYEDGSFHPDDEINRAEFTVLLNRALKLEPGKEAITFTDGDEIPEWVKPHLASVVGSGIIGGYEDGTFRADRKISRAELAVMIVRALHLKVDPDASPTFADSATIPKWASAEVAAASKAGLISGRDNDLFAPHASATRAEAVSLIMALRKEK